VIPVARQLSWWSTNSLLAPLVTGSHVIQTTVAALMPLSGPMTIHCGTQGNARTITGQSRPGWFSRRLIPAAVSF
jgi:hypothetical protein